MFIRVITNIQILPYIWEWDVYMDYNKTWIAKGYRKYMYDDCWADIRKDDVQGMMCYPNAWEMSCYLKYKRAREKERERVLREREQEQEREREKERERERERDRQTERDRDRQTERKKGEREGDKWEYFLLGVGDGLFSAKWATQYSDLHLQMLSVNWSC